MSYKPAMQLITGHFSEYLKHSLNPLNSFKAKEFRVKAEMLFSPKHEKASQLISVA